MDPTILGMGPTKLCGTQFNFVEFVWILTNGKASWKESISECVIGISVCVSVLSTYQKVSANWCHVGKNKPE